MVIKNIMAIILIASTLQKQQKRTTSLRSATSGGRRRHGAGRPPLRKKLTNLWGIHVECTFIAIVCIYLHMYIYISTVSVDQTL